MTKNIQGVKPHAYMAELVTNPEDHGKEKIVHTVRGPQMRVITPLMYSYYDETDFKDGVPWRETIEDMTPEDNVTINTLYTEEQVLEIVTRVLESLTEDDLNRIYTGDYDKPLDESAKEIAKRIITEHSDE